MTDLPPLTVVCRLCGKPIELAKDSPEARETGRDPLQQLRRHLLRDHMRHVAAVMHGWACLFDALCFSCPDQPHRWRGNIDRLVDWVQSPNSLTDRT